MKRRNLLILLLAIACMFIAWILVSERHRPASPVLTGSKQQSELGRKDAQSHSQATQIPASPVVSAQNVGPRPPKRSLRAIQAGRAASLEIVATIYSPLLDQLNLSAEARKRFLELACDERQAAYDVVSEAGKQKLSYLSDPTIERMALDAATSTDPEIRELLAPDQFNSFFDYRNMHTTRVTVAKLVESISDNGGEKLTDSQVQGLIKIFSDAQTPGQLRRAPINAVLNLAGASVTEPIFISAQTLLPSQQLSALGAIRDGQMVQSHELIGAPSPPIGSH